MKHDFKKRRSTCPVLHIRCYGQRLVKIFNKYNYILFSIQNSLILEELRTEFSDNHVTQFSFPGKVQTTPKAILIGEAEARRLKAAALGRNPSN